MTLSGSTETQNIIAKPFVKWVGGKRQLLPELESRLPQQLDVYFEPFLGGGALFFHIAHRVNIAELSDINQDLILAYNAAQNNVSGLIQELSKHKNTPEHFSQIRDADRDNEYKWSWTPIQRAARFIYLNKTCFNGLYRVNSEGHFNVPYGKYSNPKIVDAENLYACNTVLCRPGVCLNSKGYLDTLPQIEQFVSCGRSVFVYLDPPYIPMSVSSSFTKYTKDGFTMDDQLKLKEYCDCLSNLGVKWMQSNSSAPIVFEMYKNYTIDRVAVNRNVAASSGARTVVDETIIRNYES
jgi:DNA adenine methylase